MAKTVCGGAWNCVCESSILFYDRLLLDAKTHKDEDKSCDWTEMCWGELMVNCVCRDS